jgi:DNA-binding MarR family transcriptional regulator
MHVVVERAAPAVARTDLEEVAVGCAVRATRATSRALTRRYDEALRPSGLRATQFPLLVAVALHGSATVGQLAETMAMDRTTLTRELRPLEARRLVVRRPGEDRRTRRLEITDDGRQAIARTLPLWREVQAAVMEELGAQRWSATTRALEELADAAGRA